MYGCGVGDSGKDGAIFKQYIDIGCHPKMAHSGGGANTDSIRM